ncbi:MAG: hypothetical protein V7603_4530 [Micromonosporaceae bacterium]
MVLVTSLGGQVNGVVGEYLSYSERPPEIPAAGAGAAPWAGRLAEELARSGWPVRLGYPVGPWLVDVCAGTGAGAVGLICAVHPDGVEAHLRRQRALARAGWHLVDAYPSRWAGNPVEAALALASTFPH